MHFDRWPVSGPPPHFTDEADHDRRVEALLATGCLRDVGQLYWHARVSARYPTVEVRCADVQSRVDDAVLLAGLTRALVITALHDIDDGTAYDPLTPELVRGMTWTAARHGLEGDLYDWRQGRRRPAAELVADLLERLRPALAAAGDEEQVGELADRVLLEGTGAVRQRRVVREHGARALVDVLAKETAAGR